MKHYVRVVRPRFEMQFIEVEAKDHAEAEAKAVVEAAKATRGWKLIKYDPHDYGPHAEVCVSEEDLAHEARAHELQMLSSQEPLEDYVYLLMQGDRNSGSGDIMWEPWFSGVSTLMAADICSDWADNLVWLAPEDPFEGMVPDDDRPIIVPFTRRKPPDDDDPGSAA